MDVARKLNSFRDVDHAAVRGGAEPAVTHLAELALDDGCSRLVYGQGRGDRRRSGRAHRLTAQRHKGGQERVLVDQQDQLLRSPGQQGRVPLAERCRRRLVIMGRRRCEPLA